MPVREGLVSPQQADTQKNRMVTKMGRRIGIGTLVGAVFGLVLPLVLGYRFGDEELIISLAVFPVVGAGFVFLAHRMSSLERTPLTRSKQGRFTALLFFFFMFALCRGSFLMAALNGIAALSALVYYLRMEEADDATGKRAASTWLPTKKCPYCSDPDNQEVGAAVCHYCGRDLRA